MVYQKLFKFDGSGYLIGVKAQKPLHKFMKFEYFQELIVNKRMILNRPDLWDDPFEYFLLKTKWTGNDKEPIYERAMNFFGACWTIRKECDGFWRNYAQLENGIRISTTAHKLLQAVKPVPPPSIPGIHVVSPPEHFIGKVKYMKEKEIISQLKGYISEIRKTGRVSTNAKDYIEKWFLVKRKEFSYEHEVRLIVKYSNTDDLEFLAFDIDPLQLINGIMFSPCFDKAQYQKERESLISLGFKPKQITMSQLYEPYKISIE